MIHKWLDELCEEYEHTWNRGDSGILGRLRGFLETKEPSRDRQIEAFQAVAEIDVERDWQWWRKWMKREVDSRPESELLFEFARNTRIQQIQEAAAHFGVKDDCLGELIDTEYRARKAWGDHPHLNEYANLARPPFSEPGSRHRVILRFLRDAEIRDFALYGLTEFGRQRTNEPTAAERQILPNRIEIAGRTDARFSRRQVQIQILSPEYVHVTNLSGPHSLVLGNDVTLLQQQSAVVAFPFRIRFLDVVLEFV